MNSDLDEYLSNCNLRVSQRRKKNNSSQSIYSCRSRGIARLLTTIVFESMQFWPYCCFVSLGTSWEIRIRFEFNRNHVSTTATSL